MRHWFIGAAALALASADALAADMPIYRPPPRYIPPPVISWTGFYLGVNAGYSWGISPFVTPSQSMTLLRVGPPEEATMAATAAIGSGLRFRTPGNSFVGGLQVGFNWQASNGLVLGLETDAQGFSNVMTKRTNATIINADDGLGGSIPLGTIATGMRSLDFLGTLRARVGFLVTPTFLLYGTGGFAYGSIRASYSVTQALYADNVLFNAASWGGQSSFATMRAGWTLGLGAEWMVYPGVTLKTEYLYYALGTHSTPLIGYVDPTNINGDPAWQNVARVHTRFNGNIIRLGVNYLFSATGPAATTPFAPTPSAVSPVMAARY